jgi:Ca2+-binding RTX toxin-like protein
MRRCEKAMRPPRPFGHCNTVPGPEVTDGTTTLEWTQPGLAEKLLSGEGDDVITGNDLANRIEGNAGADTISGGGATTIY